MFWIAFGVALAATLWSGVEAWWRRGPRLAWFAALLALIAALLLLLALHAPTSWVAAAAVALGGASAIAVTLVPRKRLHVSSPGLPPADLAALQKAVETMQIGVTITDLRGKIIYSNPADARLHGFEPAELVGQDVGVFAPGNTRHRISAPEYKDFASWEREAVNLRRDGSTFTALLLSDVVRDARGEPIAVVTTCEDITERKRNEERLYHDAFHDGLTNLPNRAMFTQLLERAIARMRRRGGPQYAVLFLDLDRFKVVNDSLGHALGDLLLVEAASRLNKCVRPGDVVARLGGDEFTILLDSVDSPSDATRVAHRVLQALEARFDLDSHELFVSGSIGIAVGSTDYHTPEEVLRDADIAMYRAKARGVGRYELFDKTMHQRAVELLELETGLRRALERGELRLHYQPILTLGGKDICGFEALLRWAHPTRGLLEPAAFVPVAEETGLIVRIGWWTLEEACRQLKLWQGAFPQDPPLTMSVNLSPLQFQQADLVPRVIATTEYHDVAPESLRLEITEGALMRSADANIAVLEDLAMAGVRVMIDDFGTGYSSLSYLQRFRVSTLKIDKSFVGSLADAQNTEIVRTIISLARALGLSVVAEGVETVEAHAALSRLGCDEVQGFLFWGALQADEIESLLRRPAA